MRCTTTTLSKQPFFKFEILHTSTKSNARAGLLTTPHGTIKTPAFVPVGTNGAMKCLPHQDVPGMELMFSNTYHLLLQPGLDIIQKAGGLHKFMNRDTPIITDSGGFQVFSLQHNGTLADERSEIKRAQPKQNQSQGRVLTINEKGVSFRSYIDGSQMLLSPESSVDAQKVFGADIIIPLDELPAHHISEATLLSSLERTHRWEERSLQRHLQHVNNQAMYGVIHGSTSERMRTLSTNHLLQLPFDGYCIGGSLGKDAHDLKAILRTVMPLLLNDVQRRPVHLLGIGDEAGILNGVLQGVDQFDSALPTKVARHGTVFVDNQKIGHPVSRTALPGTIPNRMNIRSSKFKDDYRPIDEECDCVACKNHSRAYLHHLVKAKEPVVHALLSHHNLRYTLKLMETQRDMILAGEL